MGSGVRPNKAKMGHRPQAASSSESTAGQAGRSMQKASGEVTNSTKLQPACLHVPACACCVADTNCMLGVTFDACICNSRPSGVQPAASLCHNDHNDNDNNSNLQAFQLIVGQVPTRCA